MSDRATLVARLRAALATQYQDHPAAVDAATVREAIAALAAPLVPAFHFHSKRCYATGPGETEVLICGLAETPREKDPVKRLHNLVDSLQRCDRCESEIGDGDTTVLCEKCAAPPVPEGDALKRYGQHLDDCELQKAPVARIRKGCTCGFTDALRRAAPAVGEEQT